MDPATSFHYEQDDELGSRIVLFPVIGRLALRADNTKNQPTRKLCLWKTKNLRSVANNAQYEDIGLTF